MTTRWILSDKERLQMIKGIQKRIKECQEKGQNVSNLHSDYVDWLIEQAEKAERYEKALREIASEQEIGEGYFNADHIANNLIATAKEALEGDDN